MQPAANLRSVAPTQGVIRLRRGSVAVLAWRRPAAGQWRSPRQHRAGYRPQNNVLASGKDGKATEELGEHEMNFRSGRST